MRVVLASPPTDSGFRAAGYVPPMQLAYIGASVKDTPGVEVFLVDGHGEGLDPDEELRRTLELDPDVIGLSVTSGDIMRSSRFLKALKAAKPSLITVFGGHHPTRFDDVLLERLPQLDMAIRGEGDQSFPKLIGALLNGQPLSDTPGLSYRVDGRVERGEPEVIEDVDAIPYPDRSLFKADKYWLGGLGLRISNRPLMKTAGIISSRGCPHHCVFCSKLTPQHNGYRARSAENIFGEVMELSAEGYEYVVFLDENFSRSVERVTSLCHMIIDARLGMRFAFQGTLHNLSQDTLDLLHEAGFDAAVVGVESGSDAQLKRFRKAAASRAIADGIRRAKKAGLWTHGSFIHGGPGETEEDCRATREFLRAARPHSCTVYELCVYPGTEVWRNMLGEKPASDIEDTRCRMIHAIERGTAKNIIDDRIRKFWRAYALSWLHWSRIGDLALLWRRNASLRLVARRGFGNLIGFFWQLLRGRQKS